MTDEYENVYSMVNTGARSAVVGSIDESPDDAARAIELGEASGVAPSVVAGDLPTFEKNFKAKLASNIVGNNNYITEYINRNSMASRVSNDDYGNLDKVSQTVQKLTQNRPWYETFAAAIHTGIRESTGATMSGIGQVTGSEDLFKSGKKISQTSILDNPLTSEEKDSVLGHLGIAGGGLAATIPAALAGGLPAMAIQMGLQSGGSHAQQAFDQGKDTATPFVAGFATGSILGIVPFHVLSKPIQVGGAGGVSWSLAKLQQAGIMGGIFTGANELQVFVDSLLAGQLYDPKASYSPDANRMIASMLLGGALGAGFGNVKPYVDARKEVPRGMDPILDKIKAAENEDALKGLELAQKEAQASLTKERAPALFEDFLQNHPTMKIGVSPDAIRKLYGEKLPELDDGVLGFIPDLANKLRIAEASGQDIQVSLADWLTKVDPQIAKELGDDVRVRPGGVTKTEAKEVGKATKISYEPAVQIDGQTIRGQSHIDALDRASAQFKEPLEVLASRAVDGFINEDGQFVSREVAYAEVSTVRTLAGIKTLYDTGERKLELKRLAFTSKHFGPEQGFHDFVLNDEMGRPRVSLIVSEHDGGKRIYVENIEPVGKSFGPNDFGPSLIISTLRQLKVEFPLMEEVEGFRVSGAREKAGTVDSHGKTRIKLDVADLGEIVKFFDGVWKQVGTVDAKFKPKELYTQYEKQLSETVNAEIARIAGKSVDVQEANQLKAPGAGRPSGVYQQFGKERPLILWAMTAQDPTMTGRHEAMHHLRQYGFFTEGEWDILARAAQREGWLRKYKIDDRYSALDIVGKEEEAVVHAFAEWRRDPNKQVDPQVQSAFEKLKDLFDSILAKIKEIIGREPTWEELFEAADRGDIGSRKNNEPLNPWTYKESKEPELPGLTRMEDREVFAKASAVGMTVEEYKLNMKLIEQLHTEDLAKAEKRAEVEVKRRQTDTWKANEVEVRKEAVENINARPDIMADSYFRDGMFDGKLLPAEMSKLNAASLTPEQLAALPKQYVSKTGIAPDELAGFFGYHTGSAMVDGLIRFEEAHKASGKRPAEFKRQLVGIETQRLMEQRYGKLAENILDEAKEQALSETQMNLTHQDTLRIATKAKQEFAIDGEAFRSQIREDFKAQNITEVSSDTALSNAGRAMQLSRRAALKGDWQESFRQQQRHYISLVEASSARLMEMEKADFEKTAKQYQPREVSKGKSQEYTNYIQELLQKAGAPVKLLPDEIQRSIDFAGTGTLESFVNSRKGMGDDPAVSPDILEGRIKPLDQMTVREFEDFKAAIDSLDYLSKKERKIDIDGEKADYDVWRDGAVATIKQLPMREKTSQNNLVYQFDASFRRPEMMLKDLDLHQELGPLFKAVVVPLMKSKAKAFDLITDLAKHFNTTRAEFGKDWRKSMDDEIPQDFLYDPYSADWEAGDRGAPMNLKRENLIQAMLNWGTQSGREKTAGGFAMAYLQRRPKKEEIAMFEQAIKALIDQHATRQDWAYVERMQEPFKKWQSMSDTVARNVSGQIPKWIPAEDIQTPHGVIPGGYWPMKYDQLSTMTGRPKKNEMTEEGVFGKDYYRAATAKGYLKERTGFIDFVDIETSLNQAAGTMQQVIHDIAYRDGLVQAGKVIYDPKIKDAIIKHYGKEYYEQFVPWLQRIARTYDVPEVEMKAVNRVLKVARTNLVAHALPWNINVIGTPDVGTIGVGLKVLGQTAGRIAQYPLPDSWANFRANRAENVKLAMEKSDEIRHLVYNMDRDYREALERIMVQDKMGELRAKVIEWGFYPVKMASQEFRMMTFVDKYRKAISEGRTEEQAAQIADGFVRLHHGAASVVDLPSAMQGHEAWKSLTVFGGFFNSQYNFVRNIPGHVKRGEWNEVATTIGSTIVLATIVNMLFFGRPKKDEGYLSWVGRNLASVPMSWLPMVREVGAQFIEGLPQRTPLESIITASKAELNDLKKMWQNKRVEKPIQHAANVIGLYKGVPLLQAGRTGQGIYDSSRGYQKPKTIGEYWRLYMYGEMKQKR